MRGGAKLHALTYGRIVAEHDWSDSVAIDILAKASVITHRQVWRIPNLAGWEHIARPLYLRAEELEESDAPRAEQIAARRCAKEERPNHIPKHAADFTFQ